MNKIFIEYATKYKQLSIFVIKICLGFKFGKYYEQIFLSFLQCLHTVQVKEEEGKKR